MRSSTAAAVASTSARPSGRTGTRTSSTSRYWQALAKRGVRGLGDDDGGLRDAALAGVVAGDLDGQEHALGAPAGQLARAGVAVDEAGAHGDDLALHAQQARVLERVEVFSWRYRGPPPPAGARARASTGL